jgi:hypothetical protein
MVGVWSGHWASEDVKQTPDDVSQQFNAPLTAGQVLAQSESALQLGVHCPGDASEVGVPVSPVGVPVSCVGGTPVSCDGVPVSSTGGPLSPSGRGAPPSVVNPPELPLQATTSARTKEEAMAERGMVSTSE